MTARKAAKLKAPGFGPRDRYEAPVFAVQRYRINAQHALNKALREAGVSRAEFARRAGVSRSAISHALNDERPRAIDALARYVAALGYELRVDVTLVKRADWSTP